MIWARGVGVEQNLSEAVTCFRKAAEGYWNNSLIALVSNFDDDYEDDYVLAHMWYSLAAAQKEPDAAVAAVAATERDRLAALMTEAELAEAQRLENEWKRQKLWGRLKKSM